VFGASLGVMRRGAQVRKQFFSKLLSQRPGSLWTALVDLEAGSALLVAAGRARGADDDHASALAAGGSDGHVGGRLVGWLVGV